MTCYSVQPRIEKFVKGYGFLSFPKNLLNYYRCVKTATKRGIQKTSRSN